jgi:hypothetical protein
VARLSRLDAGLNGLALALGLSAENRKKVKKWSRNGPVLDALSTTYKSCPFPGKEEKGKASVTAKI